GRRADGGRAGGGAQEAAGPPTNPTGSRGSPGVEQRRRGARRKRRLEEQPPYPRLDGGATDAAAEAPVTDRRWPVGKAQPLPGTVSAAALVGPDPPPPVRAPPSAGAMAQPPKDADGRARQAVAAGPLDLSGGPGVARRPGRSGTSPPRSSSGGSAAQSPAPSAAAPSPLAASTPSPASHEASPEPSPAASNRSAGSHSSRPSQNSRTSEPVRSIHSGSEIARGSGCRRPPRLPNAQTPAARRPHAAALAEAPAEPSAAAGGVPRLLPTARARSPSP
ncbi:unnamed protein product, partial [Prorocentrum cordatum]